MWDVVKLLAEMVYLVVLFAAILGGFVEGVRWFGPRELIVNGFNPSPKSREWSLLLLEEAILDSLTSASIWGKRSSN